MDEDNTGKARRSAADLRREREADALRANLRRRKEQQRAREAPGQGETEEQRPGDKSDDR
jgi:hypothetical protein